MRNIWSGSQSLEWGLSASPSGKRKVPQHYSGQHSNPWGLWSHELLHTVALPRSSGWGRLHLRMSNPSCSQVPNPTGRDHTSPSEGGNQLFLGRNVPRGMTWHFPQRACSPFAQWDRKWTRVKDLKAALTPVLSSPLFFSLPFLPLRHRWKRYINYNHGYCIYQGYLFTKADTSRIQYPSLLFEDFHGIFFFFHSTNICWVHPGSWWDSWWRTLASGWLTRSRFYPTWLYQLLDLGKPRTSLSLGFLTWLSGRFKGTDAARCQARVSGSSARRRPFSSG